MTDKSGKLTRTLYTALALGQPEHTVSSLNTGPEIPGYNPEGKSNLYKKMKAEKEARKEVNGLSNEALAADPRPTSEIIRDETKKHLQRYR